MTTTPTTTPRKTHSKPVSAGFIAAALLVFSAPAYAGLISNGSFESTTLTASGQVKFNGDVSDWTAAPNVDLGFLYFSGTQADSLTDQFGTNNFKLWQGITDTIPDASPDGGNFIVFDGASSYDGGIKQTITGLNVGDEYQLTFYQAAGQQHGFNGVTTEHWQVSFGGDTQQSATMNNPTHDFQPWSQQSMTFTASSASQVLTFLSVGTPNGLPPMVFLDGISMTDTTTPPPPPPSDTPEPGTAGVAGASFILLAAARKARR